MSNLENEAIGIEAGYRYEDSPIISYNRDDLLIPYEWDRLNPITTPGSRVPPLWLENGEAIMDLLGD